MTYLDKILEHKRKEIEALKPQNFKKQFESQAENLPAPRDFAAALRRKAPSEPLRLIAELKKASPSRGVMVHDFKPLEIAERYRTLGASAYSVLTDEEFFQGHANYLKAVRENFDLPVLRKDFIIDESQIYEARLLGADALLLIVAALSPEALLQFRELAESLGMSALVEVHSKPELDIAVACGATIIGVNNRDLRTFKVNIQTSVELFASYPNDVIAVSESGIKTPEDLQQLADAGFDAVLIGEGLITSERLAAYGWNEK
ncbi:Indole-3-glycerol-phosphate synthase [Chloroherpeton thalassium ATCC 35110]|uniref:Indole-3-glycerol phosphate synthase n=1 Tax=Chloroherpeton thalassium (strain ATCC 35110 / GB-78) TaxID=517418 RepID=TRPC_CHLT3|nr:indole-3-glycerol phosphate synthase TrpC [Chloroherpeton thalassium]B3QZD6.1 RecName: Full=Indole-3-glycerol phosphate synthase; Short=IGPS [Chloroherpeton thalassium ATCC 35110]ACF13829.1 Indole-3-glycerol-phosphate synthase [Chloroherpeton thalassium ATCC 35110]